MSGERRADASAGHGEFRSTSARGLDFDSPPMRLWEKAKRHGIWNPADVDFAPDRRDWLGLSDERRELVLRLTSLFQAGEESVVLDLLPLMEVVAAEGRLEEELYLTSFLWEEAKHVEAFRRFLDEVADERGDLARFHLPCYKKLFYEELPRSMGRLRTDRSPEAQAEASVTYNMIVEGVLAETGYRVYEAMLRDHGLMPGMLAVVGRLRADESRHLAYGVFLLSRLVAEHGDPVWAAIARRMGELLAPAIGIVNEVFDLYDEDAVPFGLRRSDFVDFAFAQFRKRAARIERAREQSPAEVALAAVEDLAG